MRSRVRLDFPSLTTDTRKRGHTSRDRGRRIVRRGIVLRPQRDGARYLEMPVGPVLPSRRVLHELPPELQGSGTIG